MMRETKPIRCHRCPKRIEENEGYWFALSSLHVTADGLPIAGHLYCEACIDQLYREACRIDRESLLKKFFKRWRQPGRFDTTIQASRRIGEAGLSIEQWKDRCREEVSWWWERRRLVSNGMAPPWADVTEIDEVIGKYRDQKEPWELCRQLCDIVGQTGLDETTAKYGDLVQRFPDFAAYAHYCRGVWRQSLVCRESGTMGLARASAILHAEPEFRGAIWLGGPSTESLAHAKSAKSDFCRVLELDPQLHWAYFYRAKCNDVMGDTSDARTDWELALHLCPGLRENLEFAKPNAKPASPCHEI